MRRIFLNIVLWSLLFNAVIVTPLHAALHLQHGEHAATAAAKTDEPASEAGQHAENDDICALCLVASLQPAVDTFGNRRPTVTYADHTPLLLPLCADLSPPASRYHRPYSSRDPPSNFPGA